jgi:hypothetical protein
LPKNLTVKGDLWARNTQLKGVPKNLIVEGKIYCSEDSPLVNLAFEGYILKIEN